MKYSIEGFNQEEALKMGINNIRLDVIDLVILRWIVDFQPKMTKKIIEGEEFFWIKYQALLDALPILNFNKQNLYRRLKKMCDMKVLKHKNVRNNGNFSYYSFGENYIRLVMSSNTDVVSKMTEPYVKNDRTLMSKMTEQNNSSIKYTHLLNIHKETKNNKLFFKESFERFWSLYPKKQNKQKTIKWFEKNPLTEEELQVILEKLELFKKTNQWKEIKYVPLPTTFLNGKRWEDEIDESDIVKEQNDIISEVEAEIARRKKEGTW